MKTKTVKVKGYKRNIVSRNKEPKTKQALFDEAWEEYLRIRQQAWEEYKKKREEIEAKFEK